MFLKNFKEQNPLVLILSLIILILLWLNTIINHTHINESLLFGQSVFFTAFLRNTQSFPFLFYLIPILSIIIQFFIILRFNVKFILLESKTYLPAFLFVLLSSSLIPLQNLYPVYIVSPFILFSIYTLFTTYKRDKPFSAIFSSAFLIAISSLFYHFTVYYIIFIWISLFIIRKFNLREFLISVLGLSIPYILTAGYLFVFKEIGILTKSITLVYTNINETSLLHTPSYIFLAIVTILLIISIIFSFNGKNIKKISARTYFKSLIIFLLTSMGLFLIFHDISLFIIVLLPVCFLISIFFLTWRNKVFLEILFILLLMSIIYIQVDAILK